MTGASYRDIDRRKRVYDLPADYAKRPLVVTAIATAHTAAASIDRCLRGEDIPQPAAR